MIIASPDGGVDIEEVAEKTPERLRTVPIDIHQGLTQDMARDLAAFLDFQGDLQDKVPPQGTAEGRGAATETFRTRQRLRGWRGDRRGDRVSDCLVHERI